MHQQSPPETEFTPYGFGRMTPLAVLQKSGRKSKSVHLSIFFLAVPEFYVQMITVNNDDPNEHHYRRIHHYLSLCNGIPRRLGL